VVYGLVEDNQGLIWVDLGTDTLYTYNPKTGVYQYISMITVEKKDIYSRHILVGDGGNIWVLNAKSLSLYNKQTEVYQEFINFEEQIPNKESMQQISLHDGVLYLSSTVGVFAINIETKQWRKLPEISHYNSNAASFNPTKAVKVLTLHASSNNILYLGTADGVFSINISNINGYIAEEKLLNEYQLLIKKTVTKGLFFDNKLLYLATAKGLFTIDLIDNSVEFLFAFNDDYGDIAVHDIQSITKGRDGMFWLGSEDNGVYLWNPKIDLFQNYGYRNDHQASLSSNQVWSTISLPNSEDTLWVGTLNGLNAIDLKQGNVSPYIVNDGSDTPYLENDIKRIQALNEQQLIISTFSGLRLFDTLQRRYIPFAFSQPTNELLALEQYDILMSGDYLWLANEKGYYRINVKTDVIDPLEAINKQFNDGTALRFLKRLPNSNTTLLTSYDSLLGYNNKTQELKQLYQHPNISPRADFVTINNWAIDGQNILWLGFHAKGLVGLTLDTFERKYFYNQANSTINNIVYGLMTDIDGDVWFSSHDGLFMLDNVSHYFSHYSTHDGLGATEFNSRANAKINEDLFVYGSMKGVSIFSPSQLKKAYNKRNLKVHITRIDVLSRPLKIPLVIENDTSFDLNYDDVGIRVDFSHLSFISGGEIEYEFNLSGESNLAYPPTQDTYIIFPRLPSGNTSFILRARSPKTGEYSEPVALHFNVSYAPWRSPQAYISYIIISVLLLVVWYRYRQVQRQQLFDVHEQVKYREQRLQLALIGSNSEVWDWQIEDNLMFGKRIAEELGYQDKALFYSLDKYVKFIHPDDRENFLNLWEIFIANGNLDDNFSCTYRLKTIDGQWFWYKDLGKIVAEDPQGNPSRVTGSYTNITDSRAKEERAQYYGDAFKQTKDWVLIIDNKLRCVAANQALRQTFGWDEDFANFEQYMLGFSAERRLFYKNLLLSLKEGQHWSGEELVVSKNEEYNVMINISAAKNSVTSNKHYICIFTNISAQKNAENELRILANYDHLTGLPNRPLLLDRIKHGINYSNRKNSSIAVFFIDLDRFKQVNDSLGHQYGDLLLKEISQRLTSVLRADDTVARIGGDEFVILLESFNNNHHLGHIAQKIIEVVGQPTQLKNNMVSVSASIGISVYPNDAINSAQLLQNADLAMYYAKQLGRNNFQFFTDEMNVEAKERLTLVSKIKQAVIKNEFINYYQSIVDAYTGKAVGFELLMRWKSAEGIIGPHQFIPLAEELGLIIKMTESALDRGLNDLKQWCDLQDNLYISVNLAPQHFVKDNLVSYIVELLRHHQLPAQSLRLEVTESAFMFEPEKAIQTMLALSKLGVKLALDDFGLGFSSLSYLKKLPLDIIKIDRSFVAGIGVNDADQAIVDTTLVLAKRLNMLCVAEGIETKEQLDYLVSKDCHYIQGYLYSKPVPADEIISLLMINETGLIVNSPT
jgi:diguanylate cyclase (GGDEF)-like protein/PAS domain S-box-containing protein